MPQIRVDVVRRLEGPARPYTLEVVAKLAEALGVEFDRNADLKCYEAAKLIHEYKEQLDPEYRDNVRAYPETNPDLEIFYTDGETN